MNLNMEYIKIIWQIIWPDQTRELEIIMLTYSFTDIGNESIYIYLYKCIRQDIVNGKL